MKNILLVSHVFPREVDDFDNLVTQLKMASSFLQGDLIFDYHIILNLNPEIIDWNKSNIPQDFFVDKIKSSVKKLDWCNEIKLEILTDNGVFGLLEQRINLTKKFPDYFGYLIVDNDIILDDFYLYAFENSITAINQTSDFVLIPQPYCHWDNSWDVISHVPFQNGFSTDEFNPYSIKSIKSGDDIELIDLREFKFAGGWMTFITRELLSKVLFPPVKGYGMEDTYLSLVFNKMKREGSPIHQYLMKNIVVQENRKYLSNSIYSNFVYYNIDLLKKINDESKQIFSNEIFKLKL